MSKIFNVIRAEDIDCINGMSPFIKIGKSVILLKVINSLIGEDCYSEMFGDFKSTTIRYNTSSYDQFNIDSEAYIKLNDIVEYWFRYRQVHPDYKCSESTEQFAKDIPLGGPNAKEQETTTEQIEEVKKVKRFDKFKGIFSLPLSSWVKNPFKKGK